MTDTTDLMHRLIDGVADAIIAHSQELTELDQAIGDGDHGINMKRGFEALKADAAKIAAKPLPEALNAIGLLLVMKVGGASGPLYGTLFMTFGKTIDTGIPEAFALAIQAVMARGKSDTGQKTMLDVLVPVQHAIHAGGPDLLARLPRIAASAAEATIPMKAIRGRASFLGERSVGHMDPGARSASIIVAAACRVLEA
jgi:dihydroxyacetone kinase-like protein